MATQSKQYVQTVQEYSNKPPESMVLQPPKDPANWRLLSWAQDRVNAGYLIVVWERDAT